MSKSNRSPGSQFMHDLVTVDFSQVKFYDGVRVAIILMPLVIFALIVGHPVWMNYLILGSVVVLIVDMFRPLTSRRTRILVATSILTSSIVAIGMIISMVQLIAVEVLLIAIALFVMSYFRVFPKMSMMLYFASIIFVLGIIQVATPISTVQTFLLVLFGGIYAIPVSRIYPKHKSTKGVVKGDSVKGQDQQHEQPTPKMTREVRSKVLRSNLSIHSPYFQNALALTITSVVGILIAFWFALPYGHWVLFTIIVILMPVEISHISLTFEKAVHRAVGTLIGATIAIIILENIHSLWLLSLLVLLDLIVYVAVFNTKNYGFRTIFVVIGILLCIEMAVPSSTQGVEDAFVRMQNILIGCSLSLLAAFIIYIAHRKKSGVVLDV